MLLSQIWLIILTFIFICATTLLGIIHKVKEKSVNDLDLPLTHLYCNVYSNVCLLKLLLFWHVFTLWFLYEYLTCQDLLWNQRVLSFTFRWVCICFLLCVVKTIGYMLHPRYSKLYRPMWRLMHDRTRCIPQWTLRCNISYTYHTIKHYVMTRFVPNYEPTESTVHK